MLNDVACDEIRTCVPCGAPEQLSTRKRQPVLGGNDRPGHTISHQRHKQSAVGGESEIARLTSRFGVRVVSKPRANHIKWQVKILHRAFKKWELQ